MLPKGFVDAKEASFKVVKEIALDENDYRFGHTKVPFSFNVMLYSCLKIDLMLRHLKAKLLVADWNNYASNMMIW